MCIEAVRNNPSIFFLIPDRFKTQEMRNEAVGVGLFLLEDVPDYLKTQEMCIKAVEVDPSQLYDVPP